MRVLDRPRHLETVRSLLDQFPVVGLIGPRQVGKTTLSRLLADSSEGLVTRFDLENPRDLSRLEDPLLALEELTGLVILDEIQLRPEIFPTLRVLCDRVPNPARFLVLGSASPELLRQSSESLAGRIAYHELGGLSLAEVGLDAQEVLWTRGGFPRSFLASSEATSLRWRQEFVRTFLERDLASLGIDMPPAALRRFWSMVAHYHGELWNASELARSFGVSHKTVGRYLDILCATFMARRLEPWHANLAKRQVKSPKIFLSDPGILHALLGIGDREQLLGHPKAGASWEGLAIQEVIRVLGARDSECFFWRLHTGAELDLLVQRGLQRRGFEIKLTTSPRTTRSMHSAIEALGLDELTVIYHGDEVYPLAPKIRAVGMQRLAEIEPLR